MTDFHLLDARVCASVFAWSGQVGTHTVRWEAAPRDHPYAMRYACDCKGFQFRRACKHVEAARALRCAWGEDALVGSPSTPNPDGTCPKCGGPTVPVRVGV